MDFVICYHAIIEVEALGSLGYIFSNDWTKEPLAIEIVNT